MHKLLCRPRWCIIWIFLIVAFQENGYKSISGYVVGLSVAPLCGELRWSITTRCNLSFLNGSMMSICFSEILSLFFNLFLFWLAYASSGLLLVWRDGLDVIFSMGLIKYLATLSCRVHGVKVKRKGCCISHVNEGLLCG